MGNMKYKVGDKVRIKSIDWYNENKDEHGNVDINCDFIFYAGRSKHCGKVFTIDMVFNNCYSVKEDNHEYYWADEMIEGIVEEETKQKDMGEVSDGYHTFNELYEYRMLYNAALFNEFAKQGLYDVHKSRKHSDGEYPFGDSNWFIVLAELPTGQISNHYEMKDWDKFQIPEKPLANKWDEHSPRDVADRLTSFTNPKKEYPKTYKECLKVLGIEGGRLMFNNSGITQYERELYVKMNNLSKLLICRDAYWKIAGEEMGLGKAWEPDWNNISNKYCIYFVSGDAWSKECQTRQCLLSFPTEEMRDAFYENFKEEIEICKELL